MDKFFIQNAFKTLDEIDAEKKLEAEKKNILSEKLPKDLAKAYRRTNIRDRSGFDKSDIFTGYITSSTPNRRSAKYDYENASYEEITALEAKKIIKDGGIESLRFLVPYYYNTDDLRVVMFDENGKCMTDVEFQDSERKKRKAAYTTPNIIANSAVKIYKTNEKDLDLGSYSTKSTVKSEFKDLFDPDNPYRTPSQFLDTTLDSYSSDIAKDRYIKSQTERDTGSHILSYRDRTNRSTDRRNIEDDIALIKHYTNKLEKAVEENDTSKISYFQRQIDYYLENLKKYRNDYNRVYRNDFDPLTKFNKERIARIDWLKSNLNDEYKKIQDIENDKDRTLKKLFAAQGEWGRKTYDELQAQIASLENQLQELKNKATLDLKEEEEQLLDAELERVGQRYFDLRDALAKVFNKPEEISESLEPQDSGETFFRVYTEDQGEEDFIDFDGLSETDCIGEAKSLANTKEYDRVLAVKIEVIDGEESVDIIWDSAYASDSDDTASSDNEDEEEKLEEAISPDRQKTIGQLADELLAKRSNQSPLKESKAFNMKDQDQMIDAATYKAAGEVKDDYLVAVDPNAESKDIDLEAHVGDALLVCRSCKEIITKDSHDLVKSDKVDDETNEPVYNIDEKCPHCGADTGFIYKAQLADPEAEEVKELENTDETTETVTLEPAEEDWVDLEDVEDVKVESLDKLANSYFTKLYENFKEFKTTDLIQEGRSSLKVVGDITFKNNNHRLVEFIFKVTSNKKDNIILEGYNKLISDKENAFELKGKLENNSIIFESLSYNYTTKVDDQEYLVEGIEK